jgi:hypothetical protein
MAKSKYRYDVFISHAVEDKIPVANDLYDALVAKGVKVWYSGRELSIGERLIDTIFQSLDKCSYGVVILSPTYLTKIWALGEFFTFLRREQQENRNLILPVLYDITPEELAARYPLMADIVAVRTTKGIDYVATEICRAVGKCKEPPPPPPPVPWRKIAFVAFACLLLSLAVYGVMPFFSRHPGATIITETIEHHIQDLQRKTDRNLQTLIRQQRMNPVVLSGAVALYDSFWRTNSYYRNEYTLSCSNKEVSGRRNVEMALKQSMKGFTPANQYGMTNPQVYVSASSYVLYNPQSITYTTTVAHEESERYEVTVTYSEGIRMVYTKLDFPTSANDTKRHQVTITALPPTETYTFVQAGDAWVLQGVE